MRAAKPRILREHVRLGYAATEHGYQSDTVDHAIALVLGSTTRRGLYVAATRGRDDNLLCVVAESNDVAEARDILGILALDRADIPAVTQRRTLAHRINGLERDAPSASTAHSGIPDWFEPLRRQVHADLAAATARQRELATERRRLHDHVVTAEADLARVDAATHAQRQRLANATTKAERATRERATAKWRLDHSGLRQRRHARREFAAADNRAVWANHQLDQARAETSPYVERYERAATAADDARTALQHNLFDVRRDLRPRSTVVDLEKRCKALDTWRRWATGDPVDVDPLGAAVNTLQAATGSGAKRYRALAQVTQQWATSIGVDLPTPRPLHRLHQTVGPELGL